MNYIDFIDSPAVRDIAARNLDPLRAYWEGTLPFDDLLAKLQGAGPVAL